MLRLLEFLKRGFIMITNMTEGSPAKILWKFSLPMLLSVIFQQFYSIMDSIIAGKYISSSALAAVGASYPITMIFIAVATGFSIGTSVIVSNLFGGQKNREVRTAINTAIISQIVLGVVLSICGFLFYNIMMRMLNTPENIFYDAGLYLKIYIAGLVFLFLYNSCNAIFTALGDSRTPLYFLIISSIGNVILDIVFVKSFDFGIAGIAWATFIAQGLSSVFASFTLLKRIKVIKYEGKHDVFSFKMLKRISRIAIPSVLQQSFISIGTLLIQSKINSFGENVIAGYSAAVKLNNFAITCFSTLSNGISSFIAQNLGAGKLERVKKGVKIANFMMIGVAVPIIVVFFIFGRQITGIFIDEINEEVLNTGENFLKIVSPFYLAVSFKIVTDGALRGAGVMLAFTISTLSDYIVRVALAYILPYYFGENGVWIAWSVSWVVGALVSYCFYLKGSLKN